MKAIREDCDPFVKPEQAMVVTQIIEGIYESARTGKEVFFWIYAVGYYPFEDARESLIKTRKEVLI